MVILTETKRLSSKNLLLPRWAWASHLEELKLILFVLQWWSNHRRGACFPHIFVVISLIHTVVMVNYFTILSFIFIIVLCVEKEEIWVLYNVLGNGEDFYLYILATCLEIEYMLYMIRFIYYIINITQKHMVNLFLIFSFCDKHELIIIC